MDRDLLPPIEGGNFEASDVEASPSVLPTSGAGITLREFETPSHDIQADILQQTPVIFQLFSSHYADIHQPFRFYFVLKCLEFSSDF